MPKHVLVVDDNAMVRGGMRNAFESSGFNVSEAEDGVKAVTHVRQHKPDLIILDLAMPNMNGLQAAPILRQLLPVVPIVLFSSMWELFWKRKPKRRALHPSFPKTTCRNCSGK